MNNHSKFLNFLQKFKKSDPTLIESIISGYSTIYEHSTEERVKEINARLNIKPIEQNTTSNTKGLDSIVPKDEPEELDKDKDFPVNPT